MAVKGAKQVTLKAGDTFHEAPNDLHTVGRNASKTKPAESNVLLLKDIGKDFFIPTEK